MIVNQLAIVGGELPLAACVRAGALVPLSDDAAGAQSSEGEWSAEEVCCGDRRFTLFEHDTSVFETLAPNGCLELPPDGAAQRTDSIRTALTRSVGGAPSDTLAVVHLAGDFFAFNHLRLSAQFWELCERIGDRVVLRFFEPTDWERPFAVLPSFDKLKSAADLHAIVRVRGPIELIRALHEIESSRWLLRCGLYGEIELKGPSNEVRCRLWPKVNGERVKPTPEAIESMLLDVAADPGPFEGLSVVHGRIHTHADSDTALLIDSPLLPHYRRGIMKLELMVVPPEDHSIADEDEWSE